MDSVTWFFNDLYSLYILCICLLFVIMTITVLFI